MDIGPVFFRKTVDNRRNQPGPGPDTALRIGHQRTPGCSRQFSLGCHDGHNFLLLWLYFPLFVQNTSERRSDGTSVNLTSPSSRREAILYILPVFAALGQGALAMQFGTPSSQGRSTQALLLTRTSKNQVVGCYDAASHSDV